MARWEQYDFYPKKGVQWMKPAHNPTGLLIREIFTYFSNKKSKDSIN
jgi:hypothetical protein